MNGPDPLALQEPQDPVSLGFQILLGLANAGAAVTLLPVLIVLVPAQVTQIDPTTPAASLALVLAAGAFAALVGNLLAGALSDRTTSPLGRRRPWLMAGALGVSLGLWVLAASDSIGLLALGWTLVQFFGNVLLSCYGAVLPDRVPVRQRGTTQAIIGLSAPVAIMLSDLLFVKIPAPRDAYAPLIAVQLCLTGLFLLLYREAPLPREHVAAFELRSFLASFWVSPRRFPNFARIWLVWLLLWTGYNLGTGSFFFLYVQNITQYETIFPGRMVKDGIAVVQMLQIALGIPLMLAAGVLSDRGGRLRLFVQAGGVLLAAGLAGLAGFASWTPVLFFSILIGAGFSVYYNLGLALISRLLPSARDRGRYLGVINIASTLPQVVMPGLGALVLSVWGGASPLGYQVLFGAAALSAVGGVVLLRSIHLQDG